MNLSFKSALLLRITIVLLCSLAVAGTYTSWRVGQTASELSDRVIRQTSNIIDQRVVALLDDAESQARAVAGLTRPTFGGATGAVDSRSFPLLAAQLVEIIRVKPEFAAISITLERTGEFVQVGQTPSGNLSIQTTQLIAGGEMVRKDWIPYGNRLSEVRQQKGFGFDQRQSASYIRTREQNVVIWTSADVLENLPTGPALGTTCSAPIISADGEFVGVASISITLGGLSRFLKTVRVSEQGFASLFEVGGTAVRIVADPDPQRLMVDEPTGPRLVDLAEIGDPRLSLIGQEVSQFPHAATDGRIANFIIEGDRYFVGLRRIGGAQRPPWVLAVLVPENDFLNWSRETVLFFVSFTALALAAGAIVSLLLADRVVRPLRKLVRETQRIKSFEWSESNPKPSNIREIDELSRSFETLKAGLRSMEKLLPAEYARALIASGEEAKLGGQRRHLTTYFADIVGFTRLSHELPPEELLEVLSDYLDVLSNVVLEFGGTVDKFNGDDVMAFWGAPTAMSDHAAAAVRSALRSEQALVQLHQKLRDRDHPVLAASFGIATGDVIVGNVGSKRRMTYTVIGDSVNLASRLQGLNKFYQSNILASDATHQEAQNEFVWRRIDRVAVFGRDYPEDIWEPLSFANTASETDRWVVDRTEEAFRRLWERDFIGAEEMFESVRELRPGDGPATVLRDRARRYQHEPPDDDWDGTFQMTLK